jgi:hypothetical protein
MHSIEMNPAVDNTAIPLKAAPLVHPLPNCDPSPNKSPPMAAATNRVVELILGEYHFSHYTWRLYRYFALGI